MSRRIRILHAIQNLNYGGMERLFADIVRLLDRDRFESHVLCLEYFGRFAEGLEPWATLHLAPPMGRLSMVWPGPLIRQIRAIAPDVVHTHAGVWYKASLAARRAGVPRIVHTEHGRMVPDPWLARAIGRAASRRSEVVVAVSAALQDHLARRVVADPARLRLVPNGVDTEAYRPGPDSGVVRQELGIPPGAAIIGSIGRLEPIKGYDVMLEAYARLLREWPGGDPPYLVSGGEGSARAELDALHRRLGLEGRAFLPGWRDDIRDLQSCFRLFTMSSRSEGTSVSLLEAMSAGLCPVVTDVGGNRAVLGPALAHRLVPPEDPAALAAAWRAALADPARLDADARTARERVRQEFSLERMVRGYEALYTGGGTER